MGYRELLALGVEDTPARVNFKVDGENFLMI